MIETLNVELRKLTPNDLDNWLTNGETYAKMVYLGAEDSPDNWPEVTLEEYEAAVAEQETEK